MRANKPSLFVPGEIVKYLTSQEMYRAKIVKNLTMSVLRVPSGDC